MEKHPLHIKDPELQKSEGVSRSVEKQERIEGEKVPNDPAPRIEAYMDRLENIFLNPDENTRKRNIEMFRDKIYDSLLVKPDNFPDSYFELQKRIARERGQAVEEIPQNIREQMIVTAIEDQKASLDAWIDYLSSDDAVYPTWFKYYVWKNVIKLSQFDKERGEFKKRTDTTVAPYPDIYREPLAQIADIYEKVKEDNKNLKEPEIGDAFSKKFSALYADLIQKSLATSMENREEIRGEWIRYEQWRDGDAERLFQSLEGKGTGWCTAGRSTAQVQVEYGDFYVYYTNNTNGVPAQPRLAIRLKGKDKIAEVRGILPHQGVEPLMQKVLDEKLQEFGSEADAYRKKSMNMKMLTALERKREEGVRFAKDDLIFLYEIYSTIDGFGYQRDPRIEELRAARNPAEDALVVFDCAPEQIAHSLEEIRGETKTYFGALELGLFEVLHEGIEHVYTKFPEGRIKFRHVELGTEIKSGAAFLKAIKAAGMHLSMSAANTLESQDFKVVGEHQSVDLVEVSVHSLGFNAAAQYYAICARAAELGLKLCPAEVGPQLRLQYTDQSFGEAANVAMETIRASDGNENIFKVSELVDGPLLDASRERRVYGWDPENRFIFLREAPRLAARTEK